MCTHSETVVPTAIAAQPQGSEFCKITEHHMQRHEIIFSMLLGPDNGHCGNSEGVSYQLLFHHCSLGHFIYVAISQCRIGVSASCISWWCFSSA